MVWTTGGGMGNIGMLAEYDCLPEGFLEADVTELSRLLGGPSLIHLPGEETRPLFLSMLLHGNETTGFLAVQRLLREFGKRPLPRALSLFVGNVEAAAQGLRVLPGQNDFNRIWPAADGTAAALASAQEARMTAHVVNQMRRQNVFASIDLHNTSGRNPHHACVTTPSAANLYLASMFSRQILHFNSPAGVQNMAFDGLCPAITAECGQAGRSDGVGLTVEFLHRCLHLKTLPQTMPEGDFELYRSLVRVQIPERIDFSFGASGAPLKLVADMDGYNWRELPVGTQIATVEGVSGPVLAALTPDGRDVAHEFLERDGEKLRTRRPLVPAMVSLDRGIIRQDCLCYFLERVS